MKALGKGIAALAFCLGGCGARTGNEANGSNAAAPAANGLAAGNAAAPAGPCPFPNRGWRAAVGLGGTPPQQMIALTGETRSDSSGNEPMLSSADTPPPTIFLDIDRNTLPPPPADNSADPLMQPAPAGGWTESIYYYAYQPGHTTAVIRCNGREVARVPIPAPRP